MPGIRLSVASVPKEGRNREIYQRYVEAERVVALAAELGNSIQQVYVIIGIENPIYDDQALPQSRLQVVALFFRTD